MYNVSIMDLKKTLYLQKEKGETPLQCLGRFRSENKEYEGAPMTYAGRLDPIATGELLVLVGDECKKKDSYLGLDKEYEAAVFLGFQTDSYDILGVPQKAGTGPSGIKEMLMSMVGKFSQKYPPYSSKTVNGKHLHQYAREGDIEEIDIPAKEVEIYEIENILEDFISGADALSEIVETINLVSGDFRQEEIKKAWSAALEKGTEYRVVSFTIKVSSGTYIRSIADNLGGALMRLHRTKVYNKNHE
jgi:tRNA pseudouridine(55) synthase